MKVFPLFQCEYNRNPVRAGWNRYFARHFYQIIVILVSFCWKRQVETSRKMGGWIFNIPMNNLVRKRPSALLSIRYILIGFKTTRKNNVKICNSLEDMSFDFADCPEDFISYRFLPQVGKYRWFPLIQSWEI